MVKDMNKENWSKDIEEDLILLIKDWLRQTGKTQSELCQSLNLPSSRMPTLVDQLKKHFFSGGIPEVANYLCEMEALWEKEESSSPNNKLGSDKTEQLDLLDEICEDLSKINFKN